MTTLDHLSSPPLLVAAERIEAEFMSLYEASVPADVAERLGVAQTRIGSGVVLSMRNDPTGYWSKALGFDPGEPVTDELVERILAFYRAERSPGATLQFAPSTLPDDWTDIGARHGLQPGGVLTKLAGRIEDVRPDPAPTRLRVGRVERGDVRAFAEVLLRSFGMPTDGLAEMFVGSWGHPAVRFFGAWDGEDLVAGGALFVDGEFGSLNAGAALPGHRNLGAQSALIAARAAAADAAGCRILFAEIGKPEPGSSNPSLNNLRRAGLQPLYDRQNWRWSAEPETAGVE